MVLPMTTIRDVLLLCITCPVIFFILVSRPVLTILLCPAPETKRLRSRGGGGGARQTFGLILSMQRPYM